MFDLIALGELLIDFTAIGFSPGGMRLFEQNPGGAPANLACALAGLGARCAFIGKVGSDMHGDFLRDTLAARGVDTTGLLRDAAAFTTLAFVELDDAGERRFSFARGPGSADTMLRTDELPRRLLKDTAIFHFGSLSLTHEPARTATIEAVRIAKQAGAVISYDPNYRAALWPSEAEAVRQMRGAAQLADWIKISAEEAPLLTGHTEPGTAAAALLAQGASLVAVTLGSGGAYAATRSLSVQLPARPVPVADTTGAGDAFWGAFCFRMLSAATPPGQLSHGQLNDAVRFANAAASLCVQKTGGIPAMPSLSEVERCLTEPTPPTN